MAIWVHGIAVNSTTARFEIIADDNNPDWYGTINLYLAGSSGPTGGILQSASYHVMGGDSTFVTFYNLSPGTAYYGVEPYVAKSGWVLLPGSGGTSGGGGASSGPCSSVFRTKTNTASWNTSTAANTSVYNTAGSAETYGTISLISSDSSWYGYSWVWAKLVSVVETDIDVTYTIQQGARTKNIADWPYHGISIKYKDEDNADQTLVDITPTSSGYYWANATNESGYNYIVTAPFTNTVKVTLEKSLSGVYTRDLTIKFYNSQSYGCNLGCMYHWENNLVITLSVPKRTKYIASVVYSKGGTATVNNTSEVYVTSGTSVTYRATADSGCTFKGWYLPQDVVGNEILGVEARPGATAVSSNATYSKSITSDYELVAIFDGYVEPAIWDPTVAISNTYVKVSGSWTISQPFLKDSNTWKESRAFVG